MPEYQWNEAKILGDIEENYSNYKELEKETGIHALNKEDTKESFARALMLACGYTLEKTYGQEDTNLAYFGNQLTALLETAAGNGTAEYSEKLMQAAYVSQLTKKFYSEYPEVKEMLEKEKAAEPDQYDGKKTANRLLEEMYYNAMKKVAEIPYPDIDFTNLDQVREYADKYNAIAEIGNALGQGAGPGWKERLAAHHADSNELIDTLLTNSPIQSAMKAVCTDLGDPIDRIKLQAALGGRMLLDLYGENLAGMSAAEAAKAHSFFEVGSISILAAEVTSNAEPEQFQQIKDYIEAKPGSIAPFYIKGMEPVKNAAYDHRNPIFDSSKLSENVSKAAVFNQIFADFEENPAVHSESIVKRIYIDGKNAYDLFKSKYHGLEADVEERVKEDIVQALTEAKSRVELARMDITRDGRPKASVVPVKADFSALDAQKKWYEASYVKKADKLWNDDKEQGRRTAEIAEKAEERQRINMLSNAYNSSFYTSILNEMNAVRKGYADSEFIAAEQKLKLDPNAAKSGTAFVQAVLAAVNEDNTKAEEMKAFQKVYECNRKVMNAMTAKMQEKISSEKDPDSFRNDIRSIRSLMETAGISQDDMKKYGESLTGEQKEAFDRIRNWEAKVLKGNSVTEVQPAEGTASVKDSVDQMLDIYRKAFFDKWDDKDLVTGVTVAQNDTAKKQISFDALTKGENHTDQKTMLHTLLKNLPETYKEKTDDAVKGK